MKVSVETSNLKIVKDLFSSIELKHYNFRYYDKPCENFVDLLHFLKVLWTDNCIEMNVIFNSVLHCQELYYQKIINEKDYNIYKALFNNKNYLPDVVILLYDDNTEFIENFLNDPLFEKKVYKIQLEEDALDNTVHNIKKVLHEIYENTMEDPLNFRYFEQSYTNYKSINDQ